MLLIRFLADRYVEGICPHCQYEVCSNSCCILQSLIHYKRTLVGTNVTDVVEP